MYDCTEKYIAETQLSLHSMIKRHRTDRASPICKHIHMCFTYQQHTYNEYGVDQKQKPDHFESHFHIAEKIFS